MCCGRRWARTSDIKITSPTLRPLCNTSKHSSANKARYLEYTVL